MALDAIPGADFVNNAQQRCPMVLVLDCSGSMSVGDRIGLLNKGLVQLKNDLDSDPTASTSVRILVVSFGVVGSDDVAVSEWKDVMDFSPPVLEAQGITPTGRAMQVALDEIEKEKNRLKAAGIKYTRPLLYLITDGAPTDAWQIGAKAAVDAETSKKVNIFPILVGDDDSVALDNLKQFSSRNTVLKLNGLKFNELFQWLSASAKAVSQSASGQQVQLPSPQPDMFSIQV